MTISVPQQQEQLSLPNNMEWHVYGHQSVKHVFERQLAAGVFSHASVLIGPPGIGKKMLAVEFARAIVGAQGAQAHPDILILDQLADGGAEAMRAALGQVSGTPLISAYRVVIIDDTDRLNSHSANALLKTLEEPSSHTLFILIAGSQNILPTIRSRCQVFACNPLPHEQLRAYAIEHNREADESLILLAHGSIGMLYHLQDNPEEAQTLTQQLQSLHTAAHGTSADKMIAVQQFAELETDALETLLTHWLSQLKTQLQTEPRAYKTIYAVSEAVAKLRMSMNKKLVIQSLLLNA